MDRAPVHVSVPTGWDVLSDSGGSCPGGGTVSVPTGWDVLSDSTLFKLLRQKGLNRQNSEPPPVLIKIVHF